MNPLQTCSRLSLSALACLMTIAGGCAKQQGPSLTDYGNNRQLRPIVQVDDTIPKNHHSKAPKSPTRNPPTTSYQAPLLSELHIPGQLSSFKKPDRALKFRIPGIEGLNLKPIGTSNAVDLMTLTLKE